MDNVDIYKRSMQHKREAYHAVLQLASLLETMTSVTDWLDWLRWVNARSDNGTWVSAIIDGVGIDLHVPTMTLMCNIGGGDNATARYLLDYSRHEVVERAVQEYIWKEK